jgi:hypothetical protein
MPFEKGHSGNPAGRPRGAGNKISTQLRQSINAFLEDNMETVLAEWKKLEGRDKVNFWRDLLRYSIPQLQSIEMQSDLEKLDEQQLERLYQDLRAEMLRNLNNDES